jgi:nicotinate phosphoribosyltransferase
VVIFASGGLDEDDLWRFSEQGAPIDGYGIGTSLTTSSDAPALDCAYKLQEYAGTARRKQSEGKATWPGRKQVWRSYDDHGRLAGDVLTLEGDLRPGEALITPVMRDGRRLVEPPALNDVRAHAARELARLPTCLRTLRPDRAYPVQVSERLVRLAVQVDDRLKALERPG